MLYPELTELEMARHEINPRVLAYLEDLRAQRCASSGDIRVLDWGCGRGQSVAQLCRSGYAAAGVDIDQERFANSGARFQAMGLSADDLLHACDADGHLPFSDACFGFVFSEQVLEHVAELDRAVGELARVTAPGGVHLHVWPAQHELVEDHLHMPLVHWFPKNGLRKAVIALAMLCGMEPDWPDMRGEPFPARLRRYHYYSVTHTHFRPWREVRRLFVSYGFDVRFVTMDNPKLRHHRALDWLSRRQWSRPLLNWALLSFKRVELLAIKRVDSPQ